jgi:peptidoglycan/LPS O-acetylase OafA/YrhL
LPTHVLVNLTMLQGPMQVPAVDGVYWTLWTELHFYLLFALVVWRGVTYRRAVLFCLLWTVASVAVTGTPNRTLHLLVGPVESSYFVAGVAMYLIYRFRPSALLWGIIGVSWVLSLYRIRPTAGGVDVIGGTHLPWPVTAGVVTAIFLVMVAVALGWFRAVRWRWLTVAGALTYPLYLLHQRLGWAAIAALRGTMPRPLVLLTVVVGMLVAAWLVHRLVERPLAARGRTWLRQAVTDIRAADPRPTARDGAPAVALDGMSVAVREGGQRPRVVARSEPCGCYSRQDR